MNKIKQIRRLLALMLIGLLIFSCQKHDAELLDKKIVDTEVSINLANKVAKNFSHDQAFLLYPDKTKLKRSSLRSSKFVSDKKIKETLTMYDNDHTPAFYVVQFEKEGFVIISACKKEVPILAFSETGKFDYNPQFASQNGLNRWIETRTHRIQELRNDQTVNIPDDIAEQWLVYAAPIDDEEEIVSGGTAFEQEGPLLNTTWNQGCGYNDLLRECTSEGSCGRVWTGCTATATAQVMRYWKYPSSYNWDVMPNYSGSDETSILMRDIGTAVDMHYACDGSSASLSKARNALVNTFGYSSYASLVNYNTDVVVSQLNIGHPIIMQGFNSDNSEGHA